MKNALPNLVFYGGAILYVIFIRTVDLSFGGVFISFTLLVIAIVVFFTKYLNKEEQKFDARVGDLLSKIVEFNATQKYLDLASEAGIAVDEASNKFCFFEKKNDRLQPYVYSYNQLVECELVEDGGTVTKTSRASQLGGALVGGLIAGGVGTIVGGLSGKRKSSQKVRRVDLKIIVNDTRKPVHIVNFFDYETDKGSIQYQNVMAKANHWYGLISVYIKRSEQESKATEKVSSFRCSKCGEQLDRDWQHCIKCGASVNISRDSIETISKNPSYSVADELAKLVELRKNGTLTHEEFIALKQKLLSQG